MKFSKSIELVKGSKVRLHGYPGFWYVVRLPVTSKNDNLNLSQQFLSADEAFVHFSKDPNTEKGTLLMNPDYVFESVEEVEDE